MEELGLIKLRVQSKELKKAFKMSRKNILYLLILCFSFSACGKKSSLEKYPNSDYPKSYPKNYD